MNDEIWFASFIGNELTVCADQVRSGNGKLIPIFGSIPCGAKNFLDDDIRGYVEVPKEMIGAGDYYILRAKGCSMINAGINDGDLILVLKQDYAEEGQICVAYIEGEITLKRFHLNSKKRQVEFMPENNNYTPVVAKEYQILGIAKKVIKDI